MAKSVKYLKRPVTVTQKSFDDLVTALEQTDHTANSKLTRLFHYTDAAGLYGIVTSNKLRATHYKFLNDTTELRWANSVARTLLERKKESARSKVVKAFVDAMLERIDEHNSPFDAYLACLSSKRDSLSQWRAYGTGVGYCIGLNIAPLKSLNLTVAEHHFFVKVNYDVDDQKAQIAEVLNRVIRLLSAAPANLQEEAMTWAQDCFEGLISVFSLYFKHPAFADESEWRLVLLQPTTDLLFRPDPQRGIIPYLELDFGAEGIGKLPLVSVRLGPGADRSKAGLGVRRLVKQHGFPKCFVYYASAPYTTA